MNIVIFQNTGVPVVKDDEIKEYYQISQSNFLDMVFYGIYDTNDCKITYNYNKSKSVSVYGIQTTSNTVIDPKKLNILMCVENCSVGRTHYKHYNEFKHFNDDRFKIYIYNDISKIQKTDKYLAIPFVYLYIDQFVRLLTTKKIPRLLEFKDKKFCLFTSRNMLNGSKKEILNKLLSLNIGQVDYIHSFNLGQYSCYHSNELLTLFNQYKFIICFENSKSNGYITEKIFNVFLAQSIPIYDGAPDVNTFINKDSYISYEDPNLIRKIQLLNNNQILYDKYIKTPKISKDYNNENWSLELKSYISKFII
jgi:hypothetical protein